MTYQRNETPEPLASDPPAVSRKPFHPQADYVLDLLVSAGYITREKAFQTRDIAVEFGPDAAPGAPGQEAAAVQALTRLTEWAQAVHPEVSYSGDHPIAVARRALGAGEKTS